MAMPVYSRRFLGSAGLTGTGPSFTVPAGFVAVVKQLTVYLGSSYGEDVTVFLEDDTGGQALWWYDFTLGEPGYQQFYGSIVFETGSGFHMQVDTLGAATIDYSVNGYLLTSS